MRAELKAKFLQHLNQKKQDEGFTLIELLVVIIIIGILSAIALPNFLNQSAKAKQSEAKQNIGVVNRTQTAYRTENSQFATSFDVLAIGTLKGNDSSTTSNYSYTISGTTENATILANAQDASLKGYAGGNQRSTNATGESIVSSIICERTTAGTGTGTIPNVTNTGTVAPTCGGTNAYNRLGG